MNKEIFSEIRHFIDDMTHRNTKLLEENQKLKEKVRAVNKGLRKVHERSIKYKNRCFELNKKIYELEEQLEDITLCRDIASGHRKEVQDRETILLNQQKEFIKYLEDGIDICDGFLDTVKSDLQEIPYGVISANENITTRIKENETAHKVYEKILQKYKEITGGKQ